jgi:hypothetical protein
MVRRDRLLRLSAVSFIALIGALGLQACDRQGAPSASADALPLTAADTGPLASAPSVDALPAAAPAPVVRVANPDNDYAYLDQAYYEGDAFEDAPPDYAFDYGGATPWAWQGADGLEFVEPVAGGYRYYYYRPGAAYPYLIRDAGYAYAFDGPQLVVIYDSRGQVMPRSYVDDRAVVAGRYLARSQGLLDASRSAQRRSVAAANWAAASSRISAQRAELSAARARQSAWQAYGQAHAGAEQARWTAERDRRQASAQRFEGWRRADFRGAPPEPVGRRDAGLRQAQSEPPFREQDRAAGPAPAAAAPAPQPRALALEERRFAEQRPPRAASIPPDRARAPAEQRQDAREQQRQVEQAQAEAQGHQPDQQRQQEQQRQFAEGQRRQAEAQQAQALVQAAQRQEQFAQQRQAAEQAHAQAAAHPPAPQAPPQQAQQQRQPPHHPGQPPAAHPAGKDEHRERQ